MEIFLYSIEYKKGLSGPVQWFCHNPPNGFDAVPTSLSWSWLYCTLPHPATRPSKTYSMAVRASPSLSATRDCSTVTGPDSKSVRTRSKFIQLTVVDDICKCKSGWSLKTERSIVNDMYTLILLIQYGIYFWHELAYTPSHFLKLKSNICGNPLAFLWL